jgi:RsiW-degrading membrane proteinase PrsW (M82 family)
MNKTIQLVNKGLFYGMFICGVVFAFLENNLIFLFFILIPSVIVSWFAAKILEFKDLSPDYELPINIALWLNILGEMYFYYNFQYYNKVLHLAIPFLITIIIYEYISKNAKDHKPKKEIVFFTVLGMTALFEILEYFLYTILQYPLVGVFLSDKRLCYLKR